MTGDHADLRRALWPSGTSVSEPLAEQNVVPVPRTFGPTGQPDEGLQIMLGLAVSEEGMGRFNRVEVTYKVGDRRYRQVYPRAVRICAPKEPYLGPDKNCDYPVDAPDFGDGTLP